MYIDIQQHIKLPRSIRREHLDLAENCIEIGGQNSGEYRGLLAHYLLTTIPTGFQILLCHACNNPTCSNPKHLYWGTPSDNILDMKDAGTFKSLAEKTRNKMGDEAYTVMMRKASSKGGRAPKPKLSKDRIQEIINAIDTAEKTWGWKQRTANKLGVSHTQFSRYLKMVGRLGVEPR